MAKFIIKNIGPIKDVDFDLNRVNIIIGPQSSGKSTIAKIVSFFQWIEKRYLLDGEFKYDFKEQFIRFHRISENYFSENSYIQYESQYIKIEYSGIEFNVNITRKENDIEYLKTKNIYIPAERNFVSAIPNLGKYNETNDNIMSFLYDWFDAKKKYNSKKALPILNLGATYHYSEKAELDLVRLKSNGATLELKNASSGLQSIIPLMILVDYLTGVFYEESHTNSINEQEELVKIFIKHFNDILDSSDRIKEIEQSVVNESKFKLTPSEAIRITELSLKRRTYYATNLIIEEPEQNLFPETQRDFIYSLLEKIGSRKRPHGVLLTTHSPFILYAINNCLMGYNIEKNITKKEKSEFVSKDSWLDPSLVNIWEIDNKTSSLRSIKDPKTGTVSKHYFNNIMNSLMDEYYRMLSHFEYEN